MERRRLTTVVTVVDGLFVLAVRNRERLVVMSCTLLYLFGLVEIFFPFHTTTAVLSYFVLIHFNNVVYTIVNVDLFLLLSFIFYVSMTGEIDSFVSYIRKQQQLYIVFYSFDYANHGGEDLFHLKGFTYSIVALNFMSW